MADDLFRIAEATRRATEAVTASVERLVVRVATAEGNLQEARLAVQRLHNELEARDAATSAAPMSPERPRLTDAFMEAAARVEPEMVGRVRALLEEVNKPAWDAMSERAEDTLRSILVEGDGLERLLELARAAHDLVSAYGE